MFRRPTKKQLLIRRAIVSVISVLAVAVIVTGTILFVLGYRLDGSNGRLEQGALLQFETTPNGAWISIDGKVINARTATKQTVLAGSHTFMVGRDGYDTWVKSLEIKPGTVTWLDYIRLIPQKLETETVATYPSIYREKASPDLKKLIIQQKAEAPSFEVIDLTSQDIRKTTVSLPTESYDVREGQTFALERWDEGGRYVLVTHTTGETTEWIVLDTQEPARSVNISKLLGISIKDLRFAGTNGSQLFALMNDGIIRKLDLSNATISRALVTHVASFDLHDETNVITYVGTDPSDQGVKVAGVYRDGDDGPHILRRVESADVPLRIDTTRYFNDDYVAISEGLKVSILKGRYPSSSQAETDSLQPFADFTATANVDYLSFSPDGDYLVAQAGLRFISYEIEHHRQTGAVIETSQSQPHALRWLDEAYLWAVYDGHLALREFDGTNVHVINAAEPGFDVTLSQNGRYLYSVTKSGDDYQLQRVKLILD